MILIVAITLVLLCLEKSQRSAQMAAAISERAAKRK